MHVLCRLNIVPRFCLLKFNNSILTISPRSGEDWSCLKPFSREKQFVVKTLIVVNNLSPGLNLVSKKILRILTKLSDFWRKFPQISILWSYQNVLRKILRNLSSQLHQNILSENFSDFLKKLWVHHFQNFVRKFLRTQILVDRIKPWCKFPNHFFQVYEKLIQLLTVRHGERYAGQDVQVPGFDDILFPPEFEQAKEHKLLPVYVMPDHVLEVSKALRSLAKNVKVSVLKSMAKILRSRC